VLKRGRTGTAPNRSGASLPPPGTNDLRVWDEKLASRPGTRHIELSAGCLRRAYGTRPTRRPQNEDLTPG
jgi:hypothetical protein